MDAAVAVARTGFESGEWSALSPAQRKLVMLRWADLMQAHFEELAALDCVDAGKPITECLNTDMPATIEHFRWEPEGGATGFGRIDPTGQEARGRMSKEWKAK